MPRGGSKPHSENDLKHEEPLDIWIWGEYNFM